MNSYNTKFPIVQMNIMKVDVFATLVIALLRIPQKIANKLKILAYIF